MGVRGTCYKCAPLLPHSLTSSRRPPRKKPKLQASPRIPRASHQIHTTAAAAMGIYSMPAPRDSLMAYLLYNTVVSIAALAGLVRAALVFLDLQDELLPGDDGDQLAGTTAAAATAAGPSPAAERFRRSFRPARFGRLGCESAAADCSVCLARFEPEAAVNRLPCGHLFHSDCLETWLRYDHVTCPLCRARFLPLADEPPPAAVSAY